MYCRLEGPIFTVKSEHKVIPIYHPDAPKGCVTTLWIRTEVIGNSQKYETMY